MRSALLLSALAGLVASSPIANPQGMDFDGYGAGATPVPKAPAVGALSQPVTYNPAAAAASASMHAAVAPVATPTETFETRRDLYHFDARGVNDPCGKQPPGSGTVPTPDTVDAFLPYAPYAAIASNAPTPQGYELIEGFQNLDGLPYQNGFMGLFPFKSYDTIKCQEYCDAADGCVAFNMAIERDPSVAPADACPNPPSVVYYKCTLWGLPISAATAKNKGQWRNMFQVAVTESNAYKKMAPPDPIDGFTGPVALGGAINAPISYIGRITMPGLMTHVSAPPLALLLPPMTRSMRRRRGSMTLAYNFFNSYVISIDNVPQGTYCSMYTKSWEKNYSSNYGQYRGKSYYSVSQSYAYTLDPQDSGQIEPASTLTTVPPTVPTTPPPPVSSAAP